MPSRAKIPAADLNRAMITRCGVKPGTEEHDNRFEDYSELYV